MTRARRSADPSRGLAEVACACAAARQVARLLTQMYDSRLRAGGMEAPQFALLMSLHQGGPCSQGALGRRHALDKTTVSRNLQWLRRQGWIAAVRGGDRRERQFTLTAIGRKHLAAALPAWQRAQADLRAGMSAREWDAMFQSFRKVTRAALDAR